MILNSPYISGSLTVTGNTTLQGALTVTGSLSGIASTASFALTLGGTGSVGFATTGAFTATSGSASSRLTQIEQVYATTGSNSFRATQSITGSLTVTGQIIAQTLNVQQVTSSIIYSSGSNTFGCDINSRQTFTGSFYQTGSVAVFNSLLGIGSSPIIATAAALQVEQAQSNIVAIRRADCSNTGNSRILFQAYNASGIVQNTGIVEAGLDNSTTNGYIGFYAGTGAMNMKITTAGNVGIGMNAPDAKLHICNAIAGGTDNYLIIVQNCCTVADARAGIAFSNNSQTPSAGGLSGASIQTSNNGIDGAGNLLFSTLISGASCERLRITSCGKVGIGACSPRWLLEICCNTSATGGGGYPAISINNPNDAGYSAYYFFKGTNNFGGMEISNATCHIFVNSLSTFAIQTNGVERLRLNQNGGFGSQLCNFCLTGTYQTLVTVENGSYGLLMLSSCLGGGTYALYNIYNNAGVTSVNLIHGNNIPACVVGNAVRFASANSATYCDMRSSYIRFY